MSIQLHLHRIAAARSVGTPVLACVLRCSCKTAQHHPHARRPSHRGDSQQQLRQPPHAHVAQAVSCLRVRTNWQRSKPYAPFRSSSVLAQHRNLTGCSPAASPEVGGQPVRLHAQHTLLMCVEASRLAVVDEHCCLPVDRDVSRSTGGTSKSIASSPSQSAHVWAAAVAAAPKAMPPANLYPVLVH